MPGVGHNSGDTADGIVVDELRLLIERVERLNEEIKSIQSDRKEVFAEAKARGYDVLSMREVIRQRAMEKHTREERRALIDTYLSAMGLL